MGLDFKSFQVIRKMKLIKKIPKLFALVIGFSATATLTFFLYRSPHRSIFPLEPILWIRIPEIIMGLISIPILGYMMFKEMKK